jgi:hypothetical protein
MSSGSNFDFAFLRDLRESFAHFAVKSFCSPKLEHRHLPSRLP